MKILLIQPSEKPVIGQRKIRGSIMPPIGLMTIAATVLRCIKKVDVELRDFEANNGDESLDFSGFDVIGLTGTSVHMPHAYNLIKQARKGNPSALIILGGPHATYCDKQLLAELPELDAICRGEGEISFIKLLEEYKFDRKVPTIQGISSRRSLSEKLSPTVQDLDEIPSPDYNIIKLSKYQLSTHRKSLEVPFASMITSRGCPNSCVYCQTPNMFGTRLRYNSPGRVSKDIMCLIENSKIRSVVFWDDTFTANRKRTINLCKEIKNLGITWMCNTRVECIDLDLLKIMFDSGCRLIFFGVESSSDDTILKLGRSKKPLMKKTVDAFNWCKEVGIKTIGTIMIGAPGDSQDDLVKNVRFLQSLAPDNVYISIYNVTPGAADYQRALNDGSLRDSQGKAISRIEWGKLQFYGPPFGLPTVNRRFNRSDLQDAQKWAYEQFGLNKNEYE